MGGFCRQIHLTRHFLMQFPHFNHMHITLHGSRRAAHSVCVAHSFHLHAIHDVCLIVRCCFLGLSFSCFSPSSTSSLPHSTCTLPGTPSSMSTPPRVKTAAHPHNEEYFTMAKNHPLTGYEPNVLDDFHYSETSAMIFQDAHGDIDTEPSYLCDAELYNETIGKALSSPLFIQEREEPANRRQAYHSHEESLVPAQPFFHTYKYGETRVRT